MRKVVVADYRPALLESYLTHAERPARGRCRRALVARLESMRRNHEAHHAYRRDWGTSGGGL